jgi:hypothetical protein
LQEYYNLTLCFVFFTFASNVTNAVVVVAVVLVVVVVIVAVVVVVEIAVVVVVVVIILLVVVCGLVVRVPGYKSRGPGSIRGSTRFSEK